MFSAETVAAARALVAQLDRHKQASLEPPSYRRASLEDLAALRYRRRCHLARAFHRAQRTDDALDLAMAITAKRLVDHVDGELSRRLASVEERLRYREPTIAQLSTFVRKGSTFVATAKDVADDADLGNVDPDPDAGSTEDLLDRYTTQADEAFFREIQPDVAKYLAGAANKYRNDVEFLLGPGSTVDDLIGTFYESAYQKAKGSWDPSKSPATDPKRGFLFWLGQKIQGDVTSLRNKALREKAYRSPDELDEERPPGDDEGSGPNLPRPDTYYDELRLVEDLSPQNAEAVKFILDELKGRGEKYSNLPQIARVLMEQRGVGWKALLRSLVNDPAMQRYLKGKAKGKQPQYTYNPSKGPKEPTTPSRPTTEQLIRDLEAS